MTSLTTIRMRVTSKGEQYVGACLEYPVMTHGRTLEELAENMEKALRLYLEEQANAISDDAAIIAVRVDLDK